MEDIIIAVGGAECGTSPIMPYVGEKFDGKYFTMLTRLHLETALLRCGFDVMDRPRPISDPQEMIMQANRGGAELAVIISYSTFGSGKSFNDWNGCKIKHGGGRFGARSKTAAEDICAKTYTVKKCEVTSCESGWSAANFPAVVCECGYLTNFEEARLLYDPDNSVDIAEHIAMGVCEHYGMPYIPRDDITAYPPLCSSATGKRGKKIKMLQAMLCANGYYAETDGVFGRATDLAVRSLCLNNGLTESGGVTAAVWRDLLFPDVRNAVFGTKHTSVLYMQRKLYSKLYRSPKNGTFDTDTLNALNEFAVDRGLRHIEPGDEIHEQLAKSISSAEGGRPRLF